MSEKTVKEISFIVKLIQQRDKKLITDYEILEIFTKENEIWTYLRHKATGFEIAFHKCETEELGFSFNFKTPVEDPYLGTSHVLEHCIFCGSEQYKTDFEKLIKLSCYTKFNAETDFLSTRFYFYSTFEEEVFKIIPIMANYLFFAELSEEAFMQECMRVQFSEDGDGRKKEILGVIYNEMKTIHPDHSYHGGVYYKLNELNNDKIKEYYKKYYKPDNCLFVFNGNLNLETLLSHTDKFITDLQKKFSHQQRSQRKQLTCQEVIDKITYVYTSEDSELSHWLIDEEDDICKQIASYWEDGFSPLLPFCLDNKYAYSCYNWWKENNTVLNIPPVPPKKHLIRIMSEYLQSFDAEVYQQRLENLYKWQNRDTRDLMYKTMAPLVVENYDIEIKNGNELTEERITHLKQLIEEGKNKYQVVETIVHKATFSICFKPSELLSKDFFAEFSLIIYLEYYLHFKLRELGMLYDINSNYMPPYMFEICTKSTNKPVNTLMKTVIQIKKLADYNFSKTDLLLIKSNIYSRFFNYAYVQKSSSLLTNGNNFITDDIFKITPEDLHAAAVRFKKNIETVEKNQNFYKGTFYK